MYSTRLEGIAADLLSASLCGETPPIDAFELARCCGLEVVYSDCREALLLGETVFLSRRTALEEVHERIAHEIGHWALERDRGAENTEEAAQYLAGALLVPRASLVRELRAGWDLEALRRRHVHAPPVLIATRIAQVREATMAVYDEGRLRNRLGAEHHDERALLEEVLATGLPVRRDALTGAWPIRGRARVVVLAAA